MDIEIKEEPDSDLGTEEESVNLEEKKKVKKKPVKRATYPTRSSRCKKPQRYEPPVKKQEYYRSLPWTDCEVDILLKTIMQHGHTNFEEIKRALPNRCKEEYKAFIRKYTNLGRAAHHRSYDNLLFWLQFIASISSKANIAKSAESIDVVMAFKLLSMDGVVENHPLPSAANGIDFPALYRVMYQALSGHPIQPINMASMNYLKSLLKQLKLIDGPTKHPEYVQRMKEHIVKLFGKQGGVGTLYDDNKTKPPVRSYQRKKQKVDATVKPAMTINVSSNADSIQIESNGELKTCMIPKKICSGPPFTEDQMNILQSKGFNPLQLPVDWLIGSNFNLTANLEMSRGIYPMEKDLKNFKF